MTRSYCIRLHPTKTQERTLITWLHLTRELHNAALQERRDAWQKQRVCVTAYDQTAQLVAIRKVRTDLLGVPIVVLRGAIRQLDKSFAAFFRRCKSGETPGYPRFKSELRWSTLSLDDIKKSPIVAGGKRLRVPLLGKIRLGRLSRLIQGKPKALRITRDGNRWIVSIQCDGVPQKLQTPSDESVGVDLGLIHFAATSDGDVYENPRPLREARIRMERAQRRVSRRQRGSRRRRRAVAALRQLHRRVANLRRENHVRVARALVARYGKIIVERLSILGLARGYLAKHVLDAAWGDFLRWLHVKAEEAGREVVEVNPSGTSQECSGCGAEVRKSLAVRTHRCDDCGLVLDRDVNAAVNVKNRGLGCGPQGAALLARGRRRSEKPESVSACH